MCASIQEFVEAKREQDAKDVAIRWWRAAKP
jgi:hypothetical protein